MAAAVVAKMAISSPPRTRRACSAKASSSPSANSATRAVPTLPSASSGPPGAPGTTKPPLASPISARKSPMPAPMARLSDIGIASSTASRNPVSTSRVRIAPSATTTPIASGALSPSRPTSVNATTALSPIPGATANG